VSTKMKLRVPQKAENLLSRWANNRFLLKEIIYFFVDLVTKISKLYNT
jgi:hypothetical protein